MKYRSVLALLALTLASGASAKVVEQAEALQVATEFFNSSNNVQALTFSHQLKEIWNSKSLCKGYISLLSNEAPTFYVFAPETGKGFVIVSAEDAMVPILGYSFEDDAPEGELPCNLKAWFEAMDNQIRDLRIKGEIATMEVMRQWANASAMREVFVLETAKWNQYAPYYLQCPTCEGSLCLTGCVQTALAIIMKYHEWPVQGYGEAEAYTTSTKGIYVDSRSFEHTYDWDNMLLEYNEGEYTDEAAIEVSTLMADLGSLLQADYGTDETTSSMIDILYKFFYKHFDYSCTMYMVSKTSYNEDDWIQLLKTELRTNGPIFYTGSFSGLGVGHAFVFDGCTDDDYFHINWGWGGSSNGFYTLSTMNYTSRQQAIFNFKPSNELETASTLCEDVENMLIAVWNSISTDYVDVAVNYKDSYESLSNELENLSRAAEGSYSGVGQAEDDYESMRDKIEEIVAEINAMLASATQAENEYLYGLIEASINNVECVLNACQESLTVDYAEVADEFKDAFDTIEKKFNGLVQSVQNAYSKCLLTKEMVDVSTIALNEIEEKINALLQSVREAHREYLYLMVGEDIRDVEDFLGTVWTSITTEYPEEASTFEDSFQNLSSELNELQQQATDAYNDSTIADGIVEEIENRLGEIKIEAISLFESAKELTLFNALMEDVEDVQVTLYKVWAIITAEYTDVEGDFIDEYKTISDKLDELTKEISETFDARTLTEEKVEELQAKLNVIKQEIADLLADAREAQEMQETTAIGSIPLSDDDMVVYNLVGSRVRSLKKGNVYIIRYSGGTSKKLLVR